MRPFDAVLFDFGGTLFHHPPEPVLLRQEAAKLGTELPADRAEALWEEIRRTAMSPEEVARGRDLDAAVWRQRWAALYEPADGLVPGLAACLDRAMHDPWVWEPAPGAPELLRRLRGAGIAIAVVSNTGWDIRAPLRVRGLDGLVGAWVLSYEVGVAKPDPSTFLTAAEQLGRAPARTLMVGDDPTTDGGAVRAGLTVLLLPPPSDHVDAPASLDVVASTAGLT